MPYSDLPPWPTGKPPDPAQSGEEARLAAIADYEIDTLADDAELDAIVRFAATLCGAETALVTLVEADRQKFLASQGTSQTETPRSTSFCATAMLGSGLMEVLDATRDERFADYALVTGDAHVRYYIGAPLITAKGVPLGALCVIDRTPRSEPLGETARQGLLVLASAAMRRIEARRQQIAAQGAITQSEAQFRLLAENIPDVVYSCTSDFQFDFYNRRFRELTGVDGPRDAEGWRPLIHEDDRHAAFDAWYGKTESGKPFESEYRIRGSQGGWRWVVSRALPLHGPDGTIERWFGTLTDIDNARGLAEERDLLAKELAHRIKNVFAVISGLLTLRTRGKPDLEQFGKEIDGVVRALGRAQNFVFPAFGSAEHQLTDLLGALLAPYRHRAGETIALEGPSIAIGARAATPLALIVHELATNAAKYGALSSDGGRVKLTVEEADGEIIIDWCESGGPEVSEPTETGFGTRLLNTAISNQLCGSFEQQWLRTGLHCRITLPRERLEP